MVFITTLAMHGRCTLPIRYRTALAFFPARGGYCAARDTRINIITRQNPRSSKWISRLGA